MQSECKLQCRSSNTAQQQVQDTCQVNPRTPEQTLVQLGPFYCEPRHCGSRTSLCLSLMHNCIFLAYTHGYKSHPPRWEDVTLCTAFSSWFVQKGVVQLLVSRVRVAQWSTVEICSARPRRHQPHLHCLLRSEGLGLVPSRALEDRHFLTVTLATRNRFS